MTEDTVMHNCLVATLPVWTCYEAANLQHQLYLVWYLDMLYIYCEESSAMTLSPAAFDASLEKQYLMANLCYMRCNH